VILLWGLLDVQSEPCVVVSAPVIPTVSGQLPLAPTVIYLLAAARIERFVYGYAGLASADSAEDSCLRIFQGHSADTAFSPMDERW